MVKKNNQLNKESDKKIKEITVNLSPRKKLSNITND